MADQANETDGSTSTTDTTPKVTGIGGIFFFQTTQKKQKTGMPKI
ncbi:hypothetical protein [Dyadobacter sp. NIV53]|nr:hypothetical protein [Dyadobacter sp. NIV53]